MVFGTLKAGVLGLATSLTGATMPSKPEYREPEAERKAMRVEGKFYNPRVATNKDTFDTGRAYIRAVEQTLRDPNAVAFFSKHPELKPVIPEDIKKLLSTPTSKVVNKDPAWTARADKIGDFSAVLQSKLIDAAFVSIGKEPPRLGSNPSELRGSRSHEGKLSKFLGSPAAKALNLKEVPLSQNYLCDEQSPTQGYINTPKFPGGFKPYVPTAKNWGVGSPEFNTTLAKANPYAPTPEQIVETPPSQTIIEQHVTKKEDCIRPFQRLSGVKYSNGIRIGLPFFLPIGIGGGGGSGGGAICILGCPVAGGL